jgi:CubicO group peptidase (beta-lactamase class C family)
MSPPHPADNAPVMTPVGRLHVSLPDWARFIRLFLHDGGDLLTAGSLERLTTPPEGRKTSQGMGWAVPARAESPAAIFQLGSNLRWVAAAVVSRDRRRAVLVAANDGRPSLFRHTVKLGADLLVDH